MKKIINKEDFIIKYKISEKDFIRKRKLRF